MKRIVAVLLIFVMLMSVSSCKSDIRDEFQTITLAPLGSKSKLEGKTAEDLRQEGGKEFEIGTLVDTVPANVSTVEQMVRVYCCRDVFVGKVLDVQVIIPEAPSFHLHNHYDGYDYCFWYFRIDRNYELWFPFDSNFYLYTVEIEKCINSVFTTEKTTVYFIVNVPFEQSKGDAPYNVGERYIMSGYLAQYGQKTVLTDYGAFRAKVNSDGKLEGFGFDAEVMNQFNTLESFATSKEINKIFEKDYYLSEGYQRDYDLPDTMFNSRTKDESFERLISDAKKALPVNSKFKMSVKPDLVGYLGDDDNRRME